MNAIVVVVGQKFTGFVAQWKCVVAYER